MRNTISRTFTIRKDVEHQLAVTVTKCTTAGIGGHGLLSAIVNRGIELACKEYDRKADKLKGK